MKVEAKFVAVAVHTTQETVQKKGISKYLELREILFLQNILPDISHKLDKRGWSKNVLGGIFFEDNKLSSTSGAVCTRVGWGLFSS